MSAFAGLGATLSLALRRDRVRLPGIILGVSGWLGLLVISLAGLYPDHESRQGLALTIDNPGSTFLIGPIYHSHDYNLGVLIGHETLVLSSIVVALFSILTTVRHTRAEEESGRAEMIRANPAGRHVGLASALVMATLLNLGVFAGTLSTLLIIGDDAVTVAGSLTYAAALTSIGLAFAGVAAVAAQFVSTSRAATGLAGAVLAGSFLLRGIADVSDGSDELTWLSPLGWVQRTQPWADNRAWPLVLCLATAAVSAIAAGWLSTRRDLGASLRAPSVGRASARGFLVTPFGLSARLNRGNGLGWLIGLAVFASAYGPILGDADNFLAQMPILAEFMPSASDDGVRLFASIIVALGALIMTVPALQVITRMAADERDGRSTALLANGASRASWFGWNIALSLIIATLLAASFGLVLGVVGARATGDDSLGADIAVGALGYLGAIAVAVGVCAFIVGWAPRLAGAAWFVPGLGLLVMYFAELLEWPNWLRWLSPFDHVAARPGVTDSDLSSQLLLWATAAVLIALGGIGYRRRHLGQ